MSKREAPGRIDLLIALELNGVWVHVAGQRDDFGIVATVTEVNEAGEKIATVGRLEVDEDDRREYETRGGGALGALSLAALEEVADRLVSHA